MFLFFRPLNRTLRLSDALDEIVGMTFQQTGYHYPRYLCLSPAQGNSTKQLCVRKEDSDRVRLAKLDVSKYKPNEVECKVENGKVVVSGKQRVDTKHGYETSEFHRSYSLPEKVDPESVKSRIEHGVLQIEAVKQQPDEEAMEDEDKKLSLKINLGNYKPEEVNVKLQGNGLVVTAEHKTEEDSAYTYRHFKQYYTLPNEVDAGTLVSKFSQDGVLSIEAERKPMPANQDKDIEVQREDEMTENTEE